MNQLPGHYVLSKFYTHAGDPVFRKHNGDYNACCNICREGSSWMKKKRLFYYPQSNNFYCWNCNKGYSALKYISLSTGMTYEEINTEALSGHHSLDVSGRMELEKPILSKARPDLPYDSINIFDSAQQKYFNSNENFKRVFEYIKNRRLDTAVNRCNTFYISLTDYIHANRLCIPYHDLCHKVRWYQTRAVDGSEPRYLNKFGGDKPIFNIDKVDPQMDSIFMFEGPLDAMFVPNGVSLAGLSLTLTQKNQLSSFPLHDKIWVLDNPNKDHSAKDKILELLSTKQKVFRWPIHSPYKDFNEWCVKEGLNEIPSDFIMNSLYA